MTYHVGASDVSGAIYAGKAKVEDGMYHWQEKDEVTSEAINAVMAHMLYRVKPGENAFAYMNRTRSGKYLRLKLEVSEHRPEWLDEEEEACRE